MSRARALVASCSLFVSCVAVTVSAHANPLGIAFKSTTNVSLYAKPTGMVIAGRCNRNDAAFQNVRAKGGEVLAYLNPVNRPDLQVCALDTQFYMNNLGAVPLWPYPSYGQRVMSGNTHMTDMRPGSAWIRSVVSYIEKLMREGKVDGVFLDNVGARSWMPLAEWKTWPQKEKDIYTDGNIDLVRRIDEVRRRVKPSFIVVNNSIWDRGDTRGLVGERYVDGVSIEHPPGVTAYHSKYAAKPFSNLGHRRVLIIASTRTEALAWSKFKGVTHTSDQISGRYAYPNVPAVPFVNLD
jgi:hypothetical protein